jgi:hypothetical protein
MLDERTHYRAESQTRNALVAESKDDCRTRDIVDDAGATASDATHPFRDGARADCIRRVRER